MEQELVQVKGSGRRSGSFRDPADSNEVSGRIGAAVQQQDAGFAQILPSPSRTCHADDESLQRLSTPRKPPGWCARTSEEVSQVASAYRV